MSDKKVAKHLDLGETETINELSFECNKQVILSKETNINDNSSICELSNDGCSKIDFDETIECNETIYDSPNCSKFADKENICNTSLLEKSNYKENSGNRMNFQETMYSDVALSQKSGSCVPSILFTSTAMDLDCVNNKVEAVFFAVWDNILGPCLKHIWWLTKKSRYTLNSQIFQNASSYVLSGEVGRDPNSGHIVTKLFVKKEDRFVLSSFTFGSVLDNSAKITMCTLVFVLNFDSLNWYLPMAKLFHSWTIRFIYTFKALLTKANWMDSDEHMRQFLVKFLSVLHNLQQNAIPQYIEVKETALYSKYRLSENFLEQVISCHLLTCNRTIIFGCDIKKINRVVLMLCLLLTSYEKRCCQLASAMSSKYIPDLLVQGVFISKVENWDATLYQLCADSQYSVNPVTVVDVDKELVLMTALPSVHQAHFHAVLQSSMKRMMQSLNFNNLKISSQGHMRCLQPLPQTFVSSCLRKFRAAESNGERLQCLTRFVQLLYGRAHSLSLHIDKEWEKLETKALPLYCGIDQLAKELGLPCLGDLLILLSFTEKERRGFFEYSCGHNYDKLNVATYEKEISTRFK